MPKMHADEAEIDSTLVRQLLAAQFPHWADLPLARVESSGTDNAIYRLGDDMAVRLPRVAAATAQVDKEQQWLPLLAPLLPLDIPIPLALGAPAEGYPWRWSVYRWLSGDNAMNVRVADPSAAATDLAAFVTALHRVDPASGPAPGAHNFGRGVPLSIRDGFTRNAIESCGSLIDADAVSAAWEQDLHAPAWDQPPVWIHGDLLPGNLLVDEGRLSAVIDFGGLGVGDPSVDMLGAWAYLSGETRELFRSELEVDDATWARGRGWALSIALVQLPYYQHTNPVLAGISRHLISEVLADHAAAGR